MFLRWCQHWSQKRRMSTSCLFQIMGDKFHSHSMMYHCCLVFTWIIWILRKPRLKFSVEHFQKQRCRTTSCPFQIMGDKFHSNSMMYHCCSVFTWNLWILRKPRFKLCVEFFQKQRKHGKHRNLPCESPDQEKHCVFRGTGRVRIWKNMDHNWDFWPSESQSRIGAYFIYLMLHEQGVLKF